MLLLYHSHDWDYKLVSDAAVQAGTAFTKYFDEKPRFFDTSSAQMKALSTSIKIEDGVLNQLASPHHIFTRSHSVKCAFESLSLGHDVYT